MKDKINIRPVTEVAEYHDCEAIQKKVWKFQDREIIPVNELITIQRSGGLVLGAFDGNRMVGFAFGFMGKTEVSRCKQFGQLIHSSRMLAVLPEYRNYAIGFRLKLAQRDFALKQGVKLITWTFDPLQSLNAFFNISKLGVTVKKYFVNLYGNSSSVLNKDVPTDRFLAEWDITSGRVRERLMPVGQAYITRTSRSPEALTRYFVNRREERRLLARASGKPAGSQQTTDKIKLDSGITGIPMAFRTVSQVLKGKVNYVVFNRQGLPVSAGPKLKLASEIIFVEIPYDFNRILHKDNKLAIDWRLKTRLIFTHYFGKGYRVVDVLSPQFLGQGSRTSFYIMRRHKPVSVK
ncbi:MAG: hypothetical protein V1701_07755 [Planctomycetota bacterium]